MGQLTDSQFDVCDTYFTLSPDGTIEAHLKQRWGDEIFLSLSLAPGAMKVEGLYHYQKGTRPFGHELVVSRLPYDHLQYSEYIVVESYVGRVENSVCNRGLGASYAVPLSSLAETISATKTTYRLDLLTPPYNP